MRGGIHPDGASRLGTVSPVSAGSAPSASTHAASSARSSGPRRACAADLVALLRGHLASASADLTDSRPRSGESLVRAAARYRRVAALVSAAEAAL